VQRNPAILLLGPTGSGKTPLGDLIQQRGLGGKAFWHFDFGANLRDAVRRNSPDELIGSNDILFLRGVLESGALLEDDDFPIAARVLASFMARRGADRQTDIVLNGLPRHVGQAGAITQMLDVRTVIRLQCSRETVISRISSNAGGDRTGREDDQRAAVDEKLAVFQRRTLPLVDYYRKENARIEIVEVTPPMSAGQMWDVLSRRSGPLQSSDHAGKLKLE